MCRHRTSNRHVRTCDGRPQDDGVAPSEGHLRRCGRGTWWLPGSRSTVATSARRRRRPTLSAGRTRRQNRFIHRAARAPGPVRSVRSLVPRKRGAAGRSCRERPGQPGSFAQAVVATSTRMRHPAGTGPWPPRDPSTHAVDCCPQVSVVEMPLDVAVISSYADVPLQPAYTPDNRVL